MAESKLNAVKDSGAIPQAEALGLASLVHYADGSVVSRTLTKGKAGTMTVFAFDAGQALSEHSAPFDAYIQVLDGEGELVIGGKAVAAKAGEVVLMPANIPHAVNARQRFKMLLLMFRNQE
jgi:quercetin dioxygenase-like cupin family protein